MRLIRQDELHVEDLSLLEKDRKKDEENKIEDDPNNATNYPDDKRPKSASKVTPEDAVKAIEEEEENLRTEEDPPSFIKQLGVEPYIRFADFCKYLSLFNQRTGLDEKI
jgi:hypothetical protein